MHLAFNIGKKEYIITSAQQDPLDSDNLLLNRAATMVQQLSKWDMWMTGRSFLSLKDPMKLKESSNCLIILHFIVHLNNYQTSNIGISQILYSFNKKNRM